MQLSRSWIFKNTLLTGGCASVRGSNVSTFSGGGPTNVLDSRVYHHGGGSSGHLRTGSTQLSSPFVSVRGIYCGGGLSFSTFAGRDSSNVSVCFGNCEDFWYYCQTSKLFVHFLFIF
ncbi:unnamed protein product [Meloidogyne enterolobii]|uniref:Uncharacterized protein n=1 Tax=Meloidogyne enterolobii TaxID=390850 RepID=A0ACB0XLK0_MELEN